MVRVYSHTSKFVILLQDFSSKAQTFSFKTLKPYTIYNSVMLAQNTKL